MTLEQRRNDLASSLAEMLVQISDESVFHLDSAMRAARTAGVGGVLVIEVPRRVNEQPRVKFVGGGQQLSLPI